MGVPKFYRYMCTRYPCLVESLNEYQIPEIDNFYLDMNGIVHTCSHPNDSDALFCISEETIFKNIFQYLEKLFNMIKPKKVCFLSVDGVAPRAKINQQRGRRFRTAKEAEQAEAKARAKGKDVPTENKFDSNCITPGTEFMAKLTEQLKYFVTWKVSTSKHWQDCKIILSGAEVPGEGEHKIMDYIRSRKLQPDYDPNARHCFYGLDADLIILSLCTHEPRFVILREIIKYGKKDKKSSEETKFCLLSTSILREYIALEFDSIKDKLSFPFDVEKIIDDWILMGYFVGNDFIPNLPNIHIDQEAYTVFFRIYMELLPTLDGYINEAGTLNLERFEKLMVKLSEFEMELFAGHLADLKYFEARTGRRPGARDPTSDETPKDSPESLASPKKFCNKELRALIQSTDDMLLGHSDEEDTLEVDGDTEMYRMEFAQHKRDYYVNKFGKEEIDDEFLRSQVKTYVTAIQWNLNYYYNGCCSWSWHYPFHYAPYISDIKDFKDLKFDFSLDEPFLPFEQLLAVLPAASKSLLPQAYQGLMTDENSPIIDYYPLDFETDLNQKKMEWEAIVLIPFINDKRLKDAMRPHNNELTFMERKRNREGSTFVITYTSENLGLYEAPAYFPSIESHANVQLVPRSEFEVPMHKVVKGLSKGLDLDRFYAGFPTFRHIEHTGAVQNVQVRVLELSSKNESLVVSIVPREAEQLIDVAKSILGKKIYVGWPRMREARAIAVSTEEQKISLNNVNQDFGFANTRIDNSKNGFRVHRRSVRESYMSRFAIDVGEIEILVHALPLTGRQYIPANDGNMRLEKIWAKESLMYARQAILSDIDTYESEGELNRPISDVFTKKSVVFMLGHPHYGAMGEVIHSGVNAKSGRIKVAMRIQSEPNFEAIKREWRDSETQWMSLYLVAQKLGISGRFVSRITGALYINPAESDSAVENGRTDYYRPDKNVGLKLKFPKRNEELPGYTKRNFNQWMYSRRAVDLIRTYMNKFPRMFEILATKLDDPNFIEDEIFPNELEKLSDVVDWLKEQPFSNVESRGCETVGMDSEIIAKLEQVVDKARSSGEEDSGKTVVMQVKPHLLYKPGLNLGNSPPDRNAQHFLFDRIIVVKDNSNVPLGYKGTIIGIQDAEDPADALYEVLFDREFLGSGALTAGTTLNRRKKLLLSEFINISYGQKFQGSETPDISAIPAVQAPVPPKSWRQESLNAKKQGNATAPTAAAFVNPWRTNPGNNKNAPRAEPRKQQQQEQQIRIMKNEGSVNIAGRGANFGEAQKKNKPVNHGAPGQKDSQETSEKPQKKLLDNQKPGKTDSNSEFQMLWNDLQKSLAQPASFIQIPPLMPPPFVVPQPKPLIISNTGDSLQDESAFLKAMLKISDENSSAPPKPTLQNKPPSSSGAPPLVQEMFDRARQASNTEKISHNAMLQTHLQFTGRGMPKYSYLTNQQKLICAKILLPDMRTFYGEFHKSYEEACESAAAVACKELHLEPTSKPGLRSMPMNMWIKPMQNDVQHEQQHQQHHPQHPQLHQQQPPPMANQRLPGPILAPQSPQVFPNMHNSPMHNPSGMHNPAAMPNPPTLMMPQWNPRMPNAPGFPHPPPPHLGINQSRPIHNSAPMPMQILPQEIPRNVNNKPDNSRGKKNTPFVPLQAQKKTRNPKPKQAPRNQNNQTAKEMNLQPQAGQSKPKDDPPKLSKDEKVSMIEKKDTDTKKSPQAPQKVQRTPKPRKSRIAANFNSSPAPIEGGGGGGGAPK